MTKPIREEAGRGWSEGPGVCEELLRASDAEIEGAVEHADLMVLRGLIYQLTGDPEIAATTLVMGPGGYQFGDYWRMGLPLEVIIVAVATPAIMFFWPL